MAKIDLSKVINDVNKLYLKKGETSAISLGTELKTMDPKNFLTLPDWWQKSTNSPGIPLGGYVQVAGDSDSGKTSFAIVAMKCAQEQGMTIIYAETEGKTTLNDFVSWGVNPEDIILIQETIAERLYPKIKATWDSVTSNYPGTKIFLVIDSIGNVLSKHDEDIDLSETNQRPGGKGKANRAGIGSLIVRAMRDSAAMLFLNYTYDNLGSPGKTNAGGKALNFYSSVTYQTSRKGWIEKTVKGEKIRIGAKVQWKQFKNHLNKSNPGPKTIELDITAEGISLAGVGDE